MIHPRVSTFLNSTGVFIKHKWNCLAIFALSPSEQEQVNFEVLNKLTHTGYQYIGATIVYIQASNKFILSTSYPRFRTNFRAVRMN